MADEKLLQDELLSDEQLEQVVGGNSLDEYWQDRFITWLQDEGFEDYIVYSSLPKGRAGYTWQTLTNTFDKYGIEWTIQHGDEADILKFKLDGQWYYPGQVVGTGDEKVVMDYLKKLFPTK